MSKQSRRRQHRPATPNRDPGPGHAPPGFRPVEVRSRHDGWTPGRQVAFVQALAACACVEQACAMVGMSPRSYYDLRGRRGADSFRAAVDAALDVGMQRLEDALLSRALHGTTDPVFYKGEQVGERRRYDNRTALALLRARRPERYGRWRDRVAQVREHPDGAAVVLRDALRRLAEDGLADARGRARPRRDPPPPAYVAPSVADDADDGEEQFDARQTAIHRKLDAMQDAFQRDDADYAFTLMHQLGTGDVGGGTSA